MTLKILYIVPPTKTYAGIERVIDEICDVLASTYRDQLSIDVLYTSRFPDHPIENRAYNIIQTETKSRRSLLTTIRRVVSGKKYHLVVVPQVEATVVSWVASLGLGRKFVTYLHGNPNLEMRSGRARFLFGLMKTIVLHRLAGVFGIAPKQIASFKANFPSKTPHYWVPNPVRKFEAVESPQRDSAVVTYVNVGRFSYQKGQDILLSAFAKLRALRPNVRLKVVGYGAEEADIRASIARLDLQDHVAIEHYPDNPRPALIASDVYVSTSRWEGWSLAICEALRFGLPVVSTDCDFGPSDILTDTRLGRLVPTGDEDALVNAMLTYHDNLRAEQQHAAYRRTFIERFNVETVVHMHAQALTAAAKRTQSGAGLGASPAPADAQATG